MTDEERTYLERRAEASGDECCFSLSEKDLAEIVAHLWESEQQ